MGYALILLLVTRFLPGGLISLGPMSTDFLTRHRRGTQEQSGEVGLLPWFRSYLRR